MPSQISMRTSPLLSSNRLQVGGKAVISKSSTGDDMKAAARTVGSFLINTHTSIRKPHNMVSVNLNGSCGRTGSPSKCFSMSLPNGNGTVPTRRLETQHHCIEHTNGTVEVPSSTASPPPPKTEGEHSNDQSSHTDLSNRGRLMCPELAITYTGTLIGKRAGCLANKQKELEHRMTILQRKLRVRQLHMVHSHVSKQLLFNSEQESFDTDGGSASSLMDSDISMDLSSPLPAGGPSPPPAGGRKGGMHLPIQVDGASDDAFLPYLPDAELSTFVEEGSIRLEGRMRNEDSFSSLDSCVSSVTSSEAEENDEPKALTAQLVSLQTLLDSDLTEASSGEEGEVESADQYCKHDLRCFWDHARSAVGSRWVWLQRRIAELNKQIYRLDHHIKGSCLQDKFQFGSSPAPPPTETSVLPQYFSITNGSVVDRLKTTNGGLITMGNAGTKPIGTNGFSHHHSLPHLLLPEGLLGTKLQVKDLLSPSPMDRNLLFLNETSCTAARTRPLLRRVNKRTSRRVVRSKKGGVRIRTNSQPADLAFHPQLSMACELPSRIPLDSALKCILSEHSYAQLPPLSKRRKAASNLTRLCSPVPQDYEHYHSASPSPVHTPQSLDSSRDGSSRKKQPPSFLHYHTLADSASGSPWSPGVSRPSTPNFTPLQSARKRRVTSSTPLFDIDNIVIPYSMAASTRLEKLEYKEILTPSWREVRSIEREVADWRNCDSHHQDKEDCSNQSFSLRYSRQYKEDCSNQSFSLRHSCQDKEDCSNQSFSLRHSRCELHEKKRFLNFVSGGGQRKRSRPQSMTLSDTVSLISPPPPPRRITIASPSPTHAEAELVAHIHTKVLPWKPRIFPLSEADQEALVNPPPPPPVLTLPSSPPPTLTQPSSPMHSTPSQTPSCTSSHLATPVGSAPSTPCEETPAMSPAEWTVNSQFPNTCSTLSNHSTTEPALMPALPHNPIILKLTKKV